MEKATGTRQPALLTLQQAAAETGVPTRATELVLEGHLPRVQLGDSQVTWVKRPDLSGSLRRRRSPPRGEPS